MRERPAYVGVGECDCARIDVLLYHVPGTELAQRPLCETCLHAKGFTVPEPRTAEDIEMIDGRPTWKPVPPAPELLVHAGKLDLGYGHIFEAVLGADDRLVGWLHTHPDARNGAGMLCQSFCAVRPLNGSPVHQVVSDDPLTLTPSLLCRTCGAHGNVINGKWEPL